MGLNVSVIICTAGKPESLSKTLDSFSSLQIPKQLTTELLIIDNLPNSAETAVSEATICNATVRYIVEPLRGQSNARNRGLKNASGDIIVFTDDDIRFPPNWLQNLIAPIADAQSDAVVGTIRMAPNLVRSWMTTFHRICFAELLEPPDGKNTMVGANMAFHSRILKSVPEFDPQLGPGALGFCDDSLFSARVSDAGYRVAFNRTAEVMHHFDPSRLTHASLLRHAEALGRSIGYVSYHWHNTKVLLPGLRKLFRFLQIAMRRVRTETPDVNDEGCDEREMFEIKGWAFADQYLKESAGPRKYGYSHQAGSHQS